MIALAADIGGTRIKLGALRRGEVLARRVEPARSDRPLERRMPELADSLRALCAESGVPMSEVSGLGVAFPSVVDPVQGRILDEWGKFPGCSTFDLKSWGGREFGRVVVENDARAALLGEWRQGAGQGCTDVAMLLLGTGIGAAAVVDGRMLRGAHGQAGILGGHLTVKLDGRKCGCGNVGCAEAEASSAMLAEWARSHWEFAASTLRAESALDYAAVFRHAAAGDACATALRDESLAVWGAAAVNLIHAYDAEKLILGGGLMGSADVIVPRLIAWIGSHAHGPSARVPVQVGDLGDDAALVGAAWALGEDPGAER